MQLLASSVLLVALANVPGSSGSRMALRRVDLHKPHKFFVTNTTTPLNLTLPPLANSSPPGDNSTLNLGNSTLTPGNSTLTPGNSTLTIGNSTLTLGNSTLPLGNATVPLNNSTAPAANSTASPVSSSAPSSKPTAAPPAVTDLPISNLLNTTCNDLTTMNPYEQWNAVFGDMVLTNMTSAFIGNLAICTDCMGLKPEECKSSNPGCRHGLKDLSKDGGSTPRWDTAAARFAVDADLTDLKCGIGSNACGGAPSCASCSGPGTFALLKSMSTLSNALNNCHNAVKTASQSATNQMTQFSSVFAPIPQPAHDVFSELFESIFSGIIGMIPGVGGEIAAAIHEIGSALASAVKQATPSSPADTATVLGVITDGILNMWQDFSDQIFQKGRYVAKDGKVITFQRLAESGALMGNGSDFGPLVPTYGRLLFQQLALYTWQNLESGDQQHMPIIAFDPQPCDKVDKSKSVIKGAADQDSGFTYKGTCYYLLDALPATITSFGRGASARTVCRADKALPGGTNKALSDNSQLFSGLTLADFIVPAVEGWLANNKQNGYATAGSNGALLKDPQAAGAVSIPVCDYAANSKNGGKGCPKINSMSGKQKCDTT